MKRSNQWFRFVVLLLAISGVALGADAVQVAQDHVLANQASLGLTTSDLDGWAVKNSYRTSHNGVSHVYLVQRVGGIEVFNGIMNVTVSPNDQVLGVGNRFVPHLSMKLNTLAPTVTVTDAVRRVAAEVGAVPPSSLTVLQASVTGDQETIFASAPGFSLENVEAKLMLLPRGSGTVRLVWNVIIEPDDQHIWHVSVDAVNGAVLHKMNLVHNDTYKVYAQPAESPNHVRSLPLPPSDGRTIVTEAAANSTASPYGWHDTNGVAGADSIDVTGNNVNAQTDIDNNNVYTAGVDVRPVSVTRDFQFPLDLNQGPDKYREAAVTNLFYWNSLLHDVHYLYGFDEASGNFQFNNYGKGGLGADAVEADAQDGSGTNNANFGTRREGLAPRMQMFVWTPRIANQVAVNMPEGFGPYAATSAGFGPQLTETGVTGDVVVVNDGVGTTSDACEPISQDLSGKIALADRGTCNFTVKVENAEKAGAIAVIVANNVEGDPITMGSTAPTAITISSVMISLGHGNELKSILPANVTLRNIAANIVNRDSDLDNGVIAHEYGHGVSIRLTGGASTVTCLSGEQQGGEGWSDFHALALTANAGDTATMRRGIGTYLYYQDTNGQGIRPYPYSTDMTVNPQTYGDLTTGKLSVPHGVGSVWATTLWDMYWAITGGVPEAGLPAAGFRENLYDLTQPLAGNQIAMQLVMDGLKLQPCNPTFLDARDAILLADEINNGGKYKCYIWWAFARRGMGVNALDGDGTLNVTQDFTRPQACSGTSACSVAPTFSGVKSVTTATTGNCQLTVAWDAATDNCSTSGVSYTVYRSTDPYFTPTAANQLATGLTATSYDDSSVSSGTRYFYLVRATDGSGNTDLNTVRKSERPIGSLSDGGSFYDDSGDNTSQRFVPTTSSGWTVRATGGVNNSATYATNATGLYPADACLVLESDTIYLSETPVLTFSTSYAIEPSWDGGIVEVSTGDAGFTNWTKLSTINYTGVMSGVFGDTACDNPGLRDGQPAFHGTTDGAFIPVVGSLDEYKNKAVRIRFVFGSDGGSEDLGWLVDDIRIDGTKTVGACNAGPDAVNDRATTAEDTSVTINVLSNDTDDGSDPLTVTSVGPASHGTTTGNSDGTVTYAPNANFNGIDSFEYSISDGQGGSDTASVLVTVTAVNDAPVANDDAATTVKNTSININVRANDSDVDGDSFVVTFASAPSNGTTSINADGTVRYTPKNGYKGSDSFSYTISDGQGGTDSANVAVTVRNHE